MNVCPSYPLPQALCGTSIHRLPQALTFPLASTANAAVLFCNNLFLFPQLHQFVHAHAPARALLLGWAWLFVGVATAVIVLMQVRVVRCVYPSSC